MGAIASQITSHTIVYSTVYSVADQRKHQSSASLAFVWGIHQGPVNSPHKWPVKRKMFPFDDVIMHIAYSGHSPWWCRAINKHTKNYNVWPVFSQGRVILLFWVVGIFCSFNCTFFMLLEKFSSFEPCIFKKYKNAVFWPLFQSMDGGAEQTCQFTCWFC